jgi:hypothetical protein
MLAGVTLFVPPTLVVCAVPFVYGVIVPADITIVPIIHVFVVVNAGEFAPVPVVHEPPPANVA